MRVAIVHYHLRPGGVTRVIQNALTALEEVNATVQTVILAGEPPSSAMPVPSSVVVESLRYSTSTNLSPKQVLADLESAAASVLGGKPDLWHFHNHALGKNLIVPEVVADCAAMNPTPGGNTWVSVAPRVCLSLQSTLGSLFPFCLSW